MSESDEEYLADLRDYASKTLTLLSSAQKPERERMVARAFLRCIGVQFTDPEIQASTEEPIDTVFRTARFQIRDVLGGRKRGKDALDLQRRYEQAERVSDLREPWTSSEPMSLATISAEIAEALSAKASRYGLKGCATLDALIYVDLKDHHLSPLESTVDGKAIAELVRQGWRSVSFVCLPCGGVLTAQRDAPDFLQGNSGLVLNRWPRPDGWFEV